MHTSETRWVEVSQQVSQTSEALLEIILRSEERYQELLEVYQYAGGTDEGLAELLFYGTIGESPNPATQDEINKAEDLRLAMVAAHDLYQCMVNIAVSQGDRAASLRRMS